MEPSTGSVLMQLVISGIALGSIYALVALGFVVVFKATGILNFAHGVFMVLGAYITYTLITALHLPMWLAILVTLVLGALIGALVHVTVIRKMLGEEMFSVVMVTIGLSILIRSFVGGIWGYNEEVFPSPISDRVITILGNVNVSYRDLVFLGAAVLVVAVFVAFFRFSNIGLQMRAVADHQEAAFIVGIDVDRVFTMSWALAMIMGVIAGLFMADLQMLDLGIEAIAFKAFPALILGGLESIPGAIIGGVVIGIVEMMAGRYFGAEARDIAAYLVLFLVLIVRPFGLFGQEEIERV